jgi:hypothetical protein
MELNTVSSKYLVQRVLDSNSISDSSWSNSAMDWVFEAVRFIGKHAGLNVKICPDVYIEDYHTNYPVDMEGLLAVMYKGMLLPLGSDLSGIGMVRKFNKSVSNNGIADNDTILEINKLKAQQTELVDLYAVTPTQDLADKVNEISGKINSLEIYVSALNQAQNGATSNKIGDFFTTKMGCLQTSFPTGFIDIVYVAFPMDEEGFLRVVDNEYYIQAIEYYILLKLVQKGYKHPIFDWKTLHALFFGDARTGEIGWKSRAANNVRIPSIQEAERFTRMWEQVKFRRNLPMMLFNKTEQPFGLTY